MDKFESTPAPGNEALHSGSVSREGNASAAESSQTTGAGVAFSLVLENKPEHRVPHRPTLWLQVAENETEDLAIFIHIAPLHGQQERIIELRSDEATSLIKKLCKCIWAIDDLHRNTKES